MTAPPPGDRPAESRARPGADGSGREAGSGGPLGSPARVDGRPAAFEPALALAADLLAHARRPLVYGLADATVDAQRVAVELAERLGGAIDPAGSAAHAGAARAFRTLGAVTATLGEARARAKLLVFWGVDPDAVHPGFTEAYLAPVPNGPARATLAVDVGEALGPSRADERIAIEPESEIDVLWALRARALGRRVEPPAGSEPPGWDPGVVRRLTERLTHARYGVVFFDAEPPAARRDPLRALALTALAAEITSHGVVFDEAESPTEQRVSPARLRVIGVRPPGNAPGAEAVLTWQTGFPAAVDFAAGHPRFEPGEYDAERLLARGAVDAVLLVGAPRPGDLSPAALAALARIPAVVVGPATGDGAADARVAFDTLPPDNTPGSVYRMDGLAVRRRVSTPPATDRPTDEDVLRALLGAIDALRPEERA